MFSGSRVFYLAVVVFILYKKTDEERSVSQGVEDVYRL